MTAKPKASTKTKAEIKPPERDESADDRLALRRLLWHEKLAIAADRGSLGRYFAKLRYQPPKRSLLIAARILDGVGQPSFDYYSLGDSGFRYSYPGRWTPASTVKVAASVGALVTLQRYGLSGAARVHLSEPGGTYTGPVSHLYTEALLHSDNDCYNRLVYIAGFDALNGGVLSPRWGLPYMVIQSRYGRTRNGHPLRSSPPVTFAEGRRRGVIPRRYGRTRFLSCFRVANCVRFFELQEVLRRVVLHRELPARERFPITMRDADAIKAVLLRARNRLKPGPRHALGHPAKIYNSVGRIPRRNLLENAYIVDAVDGRRFLLALLVHYHDDPIDHRYITVKRMVRLGQHTLRFLVKRRGGMPLQHDGGAPMRLRLARAGFFVRARIFVRGATALDVWTGRRRRRFRARKVQRQDAFEVTLPLPSPGRTTLLVLRARAGMRLVSYRAVGLQRTPTRGDLSRPKRRLRRVARRGRVGDGSSDHRRGASRSASQ